MPSATDQITTPEDFAANMAKAQRHLLATNLLRAGVMPSQLAGVIAEVEDSLWLAVTIKAAVIDETTALADLAAEVERLRAGIESTIDTLTRMRITSVAIGHGSCAEAQQEAVEHLRALLAGREADRKVVAHGSGVEHDGIPCALTDDEVDQ